MRVIDNNTDTVYEIGLFEDVVWEHALKIRLLELPLVFGERGADVGFLEVQEADDHETVLCGLDLGAVHFFELADDSFEDIFDSPHAALKALVFLSPRFRAALGTDEIVARSRDA